MSHLTSVRLLLGAAICAIVPALVHAQNVPAACRPLIDAERKQINTPHHMYMSETSPGGKKAELGESITADGVDYIAVHGKWMRSPMSPKDRLDQLEENLKTTTSYECQRVGNESVGGVMATVWTMRTENEGVKSSGRVWIANGSGRIVKLEEDLDTGGGPGSVQHMSMRIEYTNVHAPAGVK